MNTQFNGERLKKARIYRGLTVAELARACWLPAADPINV